LEQKQLYFPQGSIKIMLIPAQQLDKPIILKVTLNTGQMAPGIMG